MSSRVERARSRYSLKIIYRSGTKVLTATLLLVGALAWGALFPAAGHATPIMPDFTDVPSGWYTDRYAPNAFANVGTFQGRDNVLGITITSAEALNNRRSGYQYSFYNTQGLGHDITGGPGSVISADLYIPTSWGNAANGNVRTDIWGVMTDGTYTDKAHTVLNPTDYPIIGFTNYGGAPRYRIWDENTTNGWVDINLPVNYNAWTDFAIKYTGSSYIFSINGTAVYTDTTTNGSTGFKEVIMQAYNFGDPSISGANPVNYTADWSNTPAHAPIPASLLLLGSGLFGLALLRGRKILQK